MSVRLLRCLLCVQLIALLGACQPQAPQPTALPTTVLPTPAPQCGFDTGAAPLQPGPSLEDFSFSAPRVVLNSTAPLAVAEWLPDGKRLLITHVITPGSPGEYVETVNVADGELQRYASRHRTDVPFASRPVWLEPRRTTLQTDLVDGQLNVYVGQPIKGAAATNLASPYIAISADDRYLVYLPLSSQGEPYEMLDFNTQHPLGFSLPVRPEYDVAATGPVTQVMPYRAVWHPDGKRIAFYNNLGLFLTDSATGQVCRIGLGAGPDGRPRWALDARFSPDGRILALLTTVGLPVVPFIDLTLLDLRTGALRHTSLGQTYLYSLAWAGNSRDLLAGAEIGRDATGVRFGLFLVDAATGDSRQVLADSHSAGRVDLGLAWAPETGQVAYACPDLAAPGSVSALCVTAVGQP
jgi:hypothetical protein